MFLFFSPKDILKRKERIGCLLNTPTGDQTHTPGTMWVYYVPLPGTKPATFQCTGWQPTKPLWPGSRTLLFYNRLFLLWKPQFFLYMHNFTSIFLGNNFFNSFFLKFVQRYFLFSAWQFITRVAYIFITLQVSFSLVSLPWHPYSYLLFKSFCLLSNVFWTLYSF